MRRLARSLVLALALVAGAASADDPDLNAACLQDPAACWPPGSERSIDAQAAASERDSERGEARLGASDLLHRPGAAPLTGPGTLSNDHLDLPREALVSQHVIAPLVVRRGGPSRSQASDAVHEERSGNGEVWRSVSEGEQDGEWAEVAQPSEPAASEPGYAPCVETSIRAGNGLEESLRVCRSILP